MLAQDERYTLIGQWRVGAVKRLDFPVAHTPNDDYLGCGHSSVYWPVNSIPEGKSQPPRDVKRKLRSDLAHQMSWIFGEIDIERGELF
jgi:hypothetical protein